MTWLCISGVEFPQQFHLIIEFQLLPSDFNFDPKALLCINEEMATILLLLEEMK